MAGEINRQKIREQNLMTLNIVAKSEKTKMSFAIEHLTNIELLQLHARILSELRQRQVSRTNNNPIGDYAEWLVAQILKLKLANNSTTGYDGIAENGIRYQVKARQLLAHNKSRQLSAIRNLDHHDFDYLIGIIFDHEYEIKQVVSIPWEIIGKYARFQKHTNGHIIHLRSPLLDDPLVQDLTYMFTQP